MAIPALGPDNHDPEVESLGEWDKAQFLEDWLRDLGVESIVRVDAPDVRVPAGLRPNIVAVIPGENTRKTLWIMSHTDVVPAGARSLWNTDPFELAVDGDVITGRGVEDNHQGIVSSLLLAKAVVDSGATPPINLGLLLVADEETGSAYGLDYVLKTRPELFGSSDLCIIPDFGSPDSTLVEVAEKSMLWVRVTVTGKQCHASTPDQGVNSLRAAADLICKMEELNKRFGDRDPLFAPDRSTFEPTKIEGNVPNINTVPGREVFYMDCRVLPAYDLDDVLDAMRELGQTVETVHGVSIAYEPVQRAQAAPETSPNSEVVTRLMAAIKDEYGSDAKPQGIGGGTVAAFLRRAGHPAVVWSTCVHNAHQPNENSRISWQIGDAKVFARVLWG